MGRVVLYIVGAIVLLLIAGVGCLVFLTKWNVVSDNPEETAYDETGPMVNGFAIVTKNHPRDLWGNGQDRYGFVDATGKRITFIKYRLVENFHEGRAYVRNSQGRCGFIDVTGREVIPLIYLNAGHFIEGRCLVQKKVDDQPQVGFVDLNGVEVGPFRYTTYAGLSEGYYAVGRGKMNEEKWGYVDTTGGEQIPLRYDGAGEFHNGYAVVERVDAESGTMRSGMIDKTGRLVIPFNYGSIGWVDPKTGHIEVTTLYKTANGVWHERTGKINLQNELVEPLTNVPD